MRKLHLFILVASISFAVCAPADARRSIGSGSSGYEQINRGVVDLGFFDSLLLLRYLNDSSCQSSSMVVAFIGGFTPRYFLMDNLALNLSLTCSRKGSCPSKAVPPSTPRISASWGCSG